MCPDFALHPAYRSRAGPSPSARCISTCPATPRSSAEDADALTAPELPDTNQLTPPAGLKEARWPRHARRRNMFGVPLRSLTIMQRRKVAFAARRSRSGSCCPGPGRVPLAGPGPGRSGSPARPSLRLATSAPVPRSAGAGRAPPARHPARARPARAPRAPSDARSWAGA